MQTMMESWSLLNWPGMSSVSLYNKYHIPSAVMGTVKYFDLCSFFSPKTTPCTGKFSY